MSYVKLPKGVSDYAVGYQSVNQMLDNNRALFDQFDAKHSVGVGGVNFGDPFMSPGKHDDILVARTVADFAVDTTGPTVSAYNLVSGPMIFEPPEYLADGKWKVLITTPRLFGAIATIKETSMVDRYAQARVFMDLSGPYIIVTTWNVGTGALDNYDFSLCIWAEGVA